MRGMDSLSVTFAALADPTRRAILARLARGEAHVGELGEPFAISAPAISRHLRVLEEAGLIERETQAQWRVCRVRGPGLRAAHDWLGDYSAFWEASLDRLADFLERPVADAAIDAIDSPPPARPPAPANNATHPTRRPPVRRKTR
jgi:DNA-binding transcriptional ArsR family regulator